MFFALKGDKFNANDFAEQALAQGAAARFPVSSSDLMPGLQGPALGARLRMLEDRWIGSGFVLERADLLALPDLSESDLS